MITSSGPICDVCGKYIMPFEGELVNRFSMPPAVDGELHADNKCRAIMEGLMGGPAGRLNWTDLPDGPLRQKFGEAGYPTE